MLSVLSTKTRITFSRLLAPLSSTIIASETAHNDCNMQSKRGNKVLTMDTLNPYIKAMEYAVRGPIVTKAAEIEAELKKVSQKDNVLVEHRAAADGRYRMTDLFI